MSTLLGIYANCLLSKFSSKGQITGFDLRPNTMNGSVETLRPHSPPKVEAKKQRGTSE